MCCLFVFSFVIGLHYSHSQNFVLLFISMSQTITWSQKKHFPSIRIKIISSIPHCLGTITIFKEHDQVLSSYVAQCYSCYSALHLVGFSSVTFNKEQKDLQLDYHWNSHISKFLFSHKFTTFIWQLLLVSNSGTELPSMRTANGAQGVETLRKHLPACGSAQPSI